ncbi:MAG: 30S ribosomal protein S9, partial [Parcubacteria group bacterium GW2011_GWA2_47_21]
MTVKDQTRYSEAVGRRKSAIARVRVHSGAGKAFIINNKPIAEYFKTEEQQRVATEALVHLKTGAVSVRVYGGGLSSQAEAIRHGLARVLSRENTALRSPLKKAGFLKRDPRAKERRKFGLKKARKAPQW